MKGKQLEVGPALGGFSCWRYDTVFSTLELLDYAGD